jgi:hypothetical protein
MSVCGAVVPVSTTAVFRLDLCRIAEIIRTYGFECEVRREGTVVVAETDVGLPCGPFPLLKCLERAIEKQLGEAGLVRRES